MAYTFYRSITVDHTKCGASDSTNWTLLVFGTYSYLATVANGGKVQNASGFDVGFFSDAALTTKLDWETVIYTAASGLVEYWVRIPTLSHTADTVIYMAYGDASITTDQSNKTGVWGSNFSFVYHFGDGTTLNVNDSTSNALNLTNHSAVAAAGQIGGGVTTSLSNYLASTANVAGFGPSLGWSISAWGKTSSSLDQFYVHVSTDVGAGQEYILINSAGPGFAQVGDAGGGGGRAIGTTHINNGNWHYVVGTFSGSAFKIYVDGVLETTVSATKGNNRDGVWIGNRSDLAFGFIGSIDECHALGSTVIDQSWITSEFNNQSSPSTFYTLGPEVSFDLLPGAAAFTYTGGTPVVALSGNVTLTPSAAGLTYTGGTPSIDVISLHPLPATLIYTGGTPSISPLNLHPVAATLTYTGGTPSVLVSIPLTPGPAILVYHGGVPVVTVVRTTAAGTVLYIGDRIYRYEESSGSISKVLSAPWSATFNVFHRVGDILPQPNEEVAFFVDSVKRFGGLVQKPTAQAIKGSFTVSRLIVQCTGYSAYMDRVQVAKLYTIFLGGIPSVTLFDLFGRLAQFGITQPYPQGPIVVLGEQLFDYITISEAVARVRDACPGYDYFIDDNKVARFIDTTPTTPSAPFTLRDSDRNVDEMEVTPDNSKFRNKQNVLPSANLFALFVESFTATAGQVNFPTQYTQTQIPLITVDSGGGPVNQQVTTLGAWNGAPWYVIIGGTGFFRSPGAPALVGGETVAISYPCPFPLAVTVQDDVSIAAVGLYEMTYQAKNIVDKESATALGLGLLALYGNAGAYQITMVFQYNSKQQPQWVTPGMVLDVDRTFPTAFGNFTVEQVDSQMQDDPDGPDGPGVWRHTVTCRTGLGDVTEAQALDAGRTAARVPITSPPTFVQIEFDITNAGQSTGLQPNRATVRLQPGVTSFGLASWDAWFPVDPPTGADWQCDILASTDGGATFTTIFPAGATNKMVVPDGSTVSASGIRFESDNIRLPDGTIFEANVLQVGSVNPGKYCLAHINLIQ